MSPSLLRW
jgi:hypothetical protein